MGRNDLMKNVFTTELSANNAQAVDFQMYKDANPLPDTYIDEDGVEVEIEQHCCYYDITTMWGEVSKRADADEWYYEVCPVGVQSHEKKELQDSWQSQEN